MKLEKGSNNLLWCNCSFQKFHWSRSFHHNQHQHYYFCYYLILPWFLVKQWSLFWQLFTMMSVTGKWILQKYIRNFTFFMGKRKTAQRDEIGGSSLGLQWSPHRGLNNYCKEAYVIVIVTQAKVSQNLAQTNKK